MKLAVISHPDCIKHQMTPGHPESPERIKVIQETLENSEYVDDIDFVATDKIDKNLLYLAHDKDYVDSIFDNCPREGLKALDPDTYMNPFSLEAGLRAAGSAVQAVDLLMREQYQRVFCNVRPPGHHATKNQAMGFCFFNNIVIGSLYALQNYDIKRVAIIDFDAHQGNGTIDIIEANLHVLYASSYQSPFYPFVEMPEKENLIGIPLTANTPSDIVKDRYSQLLFPKLNEFKPEIIFISAGFDAYYLDPLTNLSLTKDDFYWITKELVTIANTHAEGRIVSMLEGGYKIPELGKCALAHCLGLLEN